MAKIKKHIGSLKELKKLYSYAVDNKISIDLFLVTIHINTNNHHHHVAKYSMDVNYEFRAYAVYKNTNPAGIAMPFRVFSYYEANMYDQKYRGGLAAALFTDEAIAQEYIKIVESLKMIGSSEEQMQSQLNQYLKNVNKQK